MDRKQIRTRLKTIGIVGWCFGLLMFLVSYGKALSVFNYLDETIFYGVFGAALLISSTIIYMKSLDFIE